MNETSEVTADRLLEASWHATKLDDWGGVDIPGRLRLLSQSLAEEANLNAAGQRFAFERLLTALVSRLQVVACRAQYPEIAEQEILRPIIIPGLPRTGTTVLFNLLAQDPANRSAKTWEIMLPSPPPAWATYESDPRIAGVENALTRWGLNRPSVKAIHPYGASLSEECIFMTEQVLTHFSPYPAFWNIPSFVAASTKWPMDLVFAEHRKILQHLQSRAPAKRWLLKAPGHLAELEALTSVYPDAVFVQTHRDPFKVLPSYAQLYKALRSLSTDDPALSDPTMMMQRLSPRLQQRLARAEAFRSRSSSTFVDVGYADLVARPLATIRRVYDELELELTAEAEARMTRWLAANPKDKHGANPIKAEDVGLNPAAVDEAFAAYMKTYHVVREGR